MENSYNNYYTKIESGNLMAFWKYSAYPYLLCGVITSIKEDGLVETVEFGNGHFFKPVLILPKGQGMFVKQKLVQLQKEYEAAEKNLKEMYDDKVQEIFPL